MEHLFHLVIVGLALAILLYLIFGSVKCKSAAATMMARMTGRKHPMAMMAAKAGMPTFNDGNFGGCVMHAGGPQDMGTCCAMNPTADDCSYAYCSLNAQSGWFTDPACQAACGDVTKINCDDPYLKAAKGKHPRAMMSTPFTSY